jgi:hypothetical protein
MKGTRGPRGLVDRAGKIEGENYTGDPNGVIVPWGGGNAGVSAPAPGQPPTIPLPVDGNDDGANAGDRVESGRRPSQRTTRKTTKSIVRLPLMILANFIAWLMVRIGVTAFGDGSDGSATLDGTATVSWATKSGSTYTLSRDACLVNLTINSGITVVGNGFRLYGTGTLTILGSGLISYNGASQTTGTAVFPPNGQTIGTGGQGGNAGGSGFPGAGAAGPITNSLGGAGGDGGAAAGHAGGSAATPTAPNANRGNPRSIVGGPLMGLLAAGAGSSTGALTTVIGGGGGGGGGNTGGAGGNGGGPGAIAFAFIVLAAATNIMAAGGNGGYLKLVCIALTVLSGTMSAAVNCPGGTGGAGAGAGAAGSNGTAGTLEIVKLGAN